MDDDVMLRLENMAYRVSYAMRLAKYSKTKREQREDDLIDLYGVFFCLMMLFSTTGLH